jgi:hypothetical protein
LFFILKFSFLFSKKQSISTVILIDEVFWRNLNWNFLHAKKIELFWD